jgi:hypothetical protein
MSELCRDPITRDRESGKGSLPKDTNTEDPSSRVGAAEISIGLGGQNRE